MLVIFAHCWRMYVADVAIALEAKASEVDT